MSVYQGDLREAIRVYETPGELETTLQTTTEWCGEALAAAREIGVRTLAFPGSEGGKARKSAECALIVKHRNKARSEEGDHFLVHALMDAIEAGVRARQAHV